MILDRFSLHGRVAIVTAASKGIGAATATALAEAGADVVVGARDADSLTDVVAAIEATGRSGRAVAGDLNERSGMAALVAAADDAFGRIDIVVNNAGGTMPRSFTETSETMFERAFHWNVTTAFNLTQEAAPHLLASGNGAVVNIASTAGINAARGFLAYGTAKAAMIKMTRHLSADLAPKVRVNAVAPGTVRTASLEMFLDDEMEASMVASTPMRRIGRTEDIAAAVLYLASDASSYVTGECLCVSGGTTSSTLDLGADDL